MGEDCTIPKEPCQISDSADLCHTVYNPMMKLAGIFGILLNEDERNMIESSKVYQQYIGSDQNKLRAGVEVTKIRHLIQGEIPDGCLF